MKQPFSQEDHNRRSGRFLLANHAVLADGHLGDLVGIMEREFARLNMRVLADSPHPKHIRIGPPGDVRLMVLGYGAEVQLNPEVSDNFYAVGLPLGGRASMTIDGQCVQMYQEIGYVCSPEQEQSAWSSSDRVTLVVRVSSRAIKMAVRECLRDEPAGPLRFDPVLDLSRPEVRRWSRLVKVLAEETDRSPGCGSLFAAAHFEQFLIHELLASQPHNLSKALPGRLQVASPVAVRRAIQFCEEHAAEPISVGQIAGAARISVRTLQQQFREHLDATPMAYLQQIRLHHAHADLRAVAHGQAIGTVAEVARRWGYTHMGRFATVYRNAYGELPSETLRTR